MSVIQIRWTASDSVNYRALFQDFDAMISFIRRKKIDNWERIRPISPSPKKVLTR